MLGFFWWVVGKFDDCQSRFFFSLCTKESIMHVLMAIHYIKGFIIFHNLIFLFWRSIYAFRAYKSVFISWKALQRVLMRKSTRIFVILDKRRLVLQHNEALRLLNLCLLKLSWHCHGWCKAGNWKLLFVCFFNSLLVKLIFMVIFTSKNSVILLIKGLKTIIFAEDIWVKIDSDFDLFLLISKRGLLWII